MRGRFQNLTLCADNKAVPLQGRGARAVLTVVSGIALCPPCTGRVLAEGYTFLLRPVTLLRVVTVCVTATLDLLTTDVGVSLHALSAHTFGGVIVDLAICILPARGSLAWINTLFRAAGFGQWAIRINSALIWKLWRLNLGLKMKNIKNLH